MRHIAELVMKRVNLLSNGTVHFMPPSFHSTPSLYPLHLHIISSDLVSDAIKNKYHWNSFTLIPSFFIPIDTILMSFNIKNKLEVEHQHQHQQHHNITTNSEWEWDKNLVFRSYNYPYKAYSAEKCLSKSDLSKNDLKCPCCGQYIPGNTLPNAKTHYKQCHNNYSWI